MILKNIMEKLKIVLSLACHFYYRSCAYCFMPLWRMVQSFIDYLLQHLSNADLKVKDVPKRRLDELQLWNCFSYYPAITNWDILESDKQVNT